MLISVIFGNLCMDMLWILGPESKIRDFFTITGFPYAKENGTEDTSFREERLS